MGTTRCYSVKERVPVYILTTKIPSVFFSSVFVDANYNFDVRRRGVSGKNSRQLSFYEH